MDHARLVIIFSQNLFICEDWDKILLVDIIAYTVQIVKRFYVFYSQQTETACQHNTHRMDKISESSVFTVNDLVREDDYMPRRGENIYHRKDGRWEGRYIIRRDERGKAVYRSVYGKSYFETRQKLADARKHKQSARRFGCLTVGQLFSEWLDAVSGRLKPSTLSNYKMKLDRHLLPAFGNLRYDRLTAAAVQQFILQKMQSGLSAKYVADIVMLLRSLTRYVSRTRDFADPLRFLVLPRPEKKERTLFSKEQQTRLFHALMRTPDNTAVCILLCQYCGLRIGEVCWLKRSDIDTEIGLLTVHRTVQRIRVQSGKTALHIGLPKSKSSCRAVPVPVFLLKMIDKLRVSPDAYLLSGTAKPTDPRTLQNRFHAVLKKADLPSVNYHSLRHMFATNCIAAGADVKTLSELLGHASAETTLNRYVHTSNERKIVCMSQLCKAVLPSEMWSEKQPKPALQWDFGGCLRE